MTFIKEINQKNYNYLIKEINISFLMQFPGTVHTPSRLVGGGVPMGGPVGGVPIAGGHPGVAVTGAHPVRPVGPVGPVPVGPVGPGIVHPAPTVVHQPAPVMPAPVIHQPTVMPAPVPVPVPVPVPAPVPPPITSTIEGRTDIVDHGLVKTD